MNNLVNISLKKLLTELQNNICNNESIDDYYLKVDNQYKLITSVDLLYRIQTEDGDFTEFEWENKNSNIYKNVGGKQ